MSAAVAGGVIGIVILCGIVAIAAAVGFTISSHDPNFLKQNAIALGVGLQGIIDLAAVTFLLSVLPRLAKTSLAGLGFVAPTLAQIGIALAGAVVMVIVVDGCGALIDAALHSKHQQAAIQLFLAEKNPAVKAAFALLAVIVAPISEEITFRVFVFNAVKRFSRFWPAAIVSGILFGSAHGDLYALVPLILGGIVLCAVYTRSKNAYMSMITHGLFNSLSVVALYLFPNMAK